jgi:hypothetical protein
MLELLAFPPHSYSVTPQENTKFVTNPLIESPATGRSEWGGWDFALAVAEIKPVLKLFASRARRGALSSGVTHAIR